MTALFKAADVDGDGTLDADELRSPAGRNLEKLLERLAAPPPQPLDEAEH